MSRSTLPPSRRGQPRLNRCKSSRARLISVPPKSVRVFFFVNAEAKHAAVSPGQARDERLATFLWESFVFNEVRRVDDRRGFASVPS